MIKRVIPYIMLMLMIMITLALSISVDATPATFDDYEQLERLATVVEKNRDLLFEKSQNENIGKEITSKNSNITIIFENEQCKIVATYNENFELVESQREDKCFPLVLKVFVLIILGFCAGVIGYLFHGELKFTRTDC